MFSGVNRSWGGECEIQRAKTHVADYICQAPGIGGSDTETLLNATPSNVRNAHPGLIIR